MCSPRTVSGLLGSGWYRRAAERGDADSQVGLGALYASGRGVPQDHAEAAVWFRRAAEQGHSDGQFRLGIMHVTGDGVPQDDVAAHMWLNLAGAQGHVAAREQRDAMAASMTRAQIIEAQRVAREWRDTGR